MDVIIKKSTLKGSLLPPPSKSYSHRYLIAAMLSIQNTTIENISLCDDVLATLTALKFFNKTYQIDKNQILITSANSCDFPIINANESGSTLRFLIPIFLTKFSKVEFICSNRLLDRGIQVYEQLFLQDGIVFKREENKLIVEGKLKSTHYVLSGESSSQYISGLLFALPLLDHDSQITILPPIHSKNYIQMTLKVLQEFNIQITQKNNTFFIKGKQTYHGLKKHRIEGDFSNAAFIDAYRYFDHDIHLKSLNFKSLQGDKIYRKYFQILSQKKATIDLANCIDLGPILMSFAALKHGAILKNTKKLKIKECDRGEAMKEELAKVGVKVFIFENHIEIDNKQLCEPKEIFDSHNDHRIVMALSLLCTKFDILIKNAQAILKSYPNFFKDLISLGGNVHEDDSAK